MQLLFITMQKVAEISDFEMSAISEPTVVMFYAPWCRGSQHLTPIFENASEYSFIPFVRHNCDDSRYCIAHHILDFPMILLFIDNTTELYKGRQDGSQSILEFVDKELKYSITYNDIQDIQQLAFEQSQPTYFILQTSNIKQFQQLFRYIFKIPTCTLPPTLLCVQNSTDLKLIAVREGVKIAFQGQFTQIQVEDFVKRNARAFVSDIKSAARSGGTVVVLVEKQETILDNAEQNERNSEQEINQTQKLNDTNDNQTGTQTILDSDIKEIENDSKCVNSSKQSQEMLSQKQKYDWFRNMSLRYPKVSFGYVELDEVEKFQTKFGKGELLIISSKGSIMHQINEIRFGFEEAEDLILKTFGKGEN